MVAKKATIILLVGGFALALFGLALSYFYEKIIFYRFEQELPLKPGSESFKKWRLTPVPLIMSVYFWNWTNPEAIGKHNEKPLFVEMGPYVFREVHEKVNITWNNNGTVTFKTIKRWYFDEEKTIGSLEDEITSVNAVAASIAYLTRSWNRFLLYPVSVGLVTSGQQLSWTKKVRELLFEGFDNSIQSLGSYIPGSPALDKFGWFYKMNGTISSDTYNLVTGAKNLDEMGRLMFWNFKNSTDYYPNCSKVDGFNGEFWPPKRSKNDTLDLFATDMCRKVVYYYQEESKYRGLKTLVYAGTKESIDNGSKIPENKCYCDQECPPSGVYDVSKCQYGAPIFISYPHFYNADPFYIDSVGGMHPRKEKHRFYIELEPVGSRYTPLLKATLAVHNCTPITRTGVQVDVAARVQINVFLKKNTALSLYRNVKDIFIPVLWLEKRVSLSEEYTLGIKIMLKIAELGPFVYYGICCTGCVIFIGTILMQGFTRILLSRERRKINKRECEKGKVQKTEEIQLKDGKISVKEVEYTFVEKKC